MGDIINQIRRTSKQRGPGVNEKLDELMAQFRLKIRNETDPRIAKLNLDEMDARLEAMYGNSPGEYKPGITEDEVAIIGELKDIAEERSRELNASDEIVSFENTGIPLDDPRHPLNQPQELAPGQRPGETLEQRNARWAEERKISKEKERIIRLSDPLWREIIHLDEKSIKNAQDLIINADKETAQQHVEALDEWVEESARENDFENAGTLSDLRKLALETLKKFLTDDTGAIPIEDVLESWEKRRTSYQECIFSVSGWNCSEMGQHMWKNWMHRMHLIRHIAILCLPAQRMRSSVGRLGAGTCN